MRMTTSITHTARTMIERDEEMVKGQSRKKVTQDIHNKRRGESIAGEDVMMKSFSVSVSDETQSAINKELTVLRKN